MPVQTTPDGRMVTYVSRRELRGARITGVRSEDHESAIYDPREASRQAASIKKARELIEGMRFVKDDRLTAHDHAVYEAMLTTARAEGIRKETHRIAVADLMGNVGVRHIDRIVESLDRIADVRVSYDFDDGVGKFSLAWFEIKGLRSGSAVLSYSIPPAVREAIFESKSYAVLELSAFAGFKSRYTARLYPRLALRAGYHPKFRGPWIIDPKKLADELGYRYKAWNYRHFTRDVLDPVLKDIADSVHRFAVQMGPPNRGKGRGSPVTEIVFLMSDMSKDLREVRAAYLSASEEAAVTKADAVHAAGELPSAADVAKAATLTGRSAVEISEGWRLALDSAKASPNRRLPGVEMQGGLLLLFLHDDGVDVAFRQWIAAVERTKEALATRKPIPKPAEATAPVYEIDTPTYRRYTIPAVKQPDRTPPPGYEEEVKAYVAKQLAEFMASQQEDVAEVEVATVVVEDYDVEEPPAFSDDGAGREDDDFDIPY
jgi:hypothetical protein